MDVEQETRAEVSRRLARLQNKYGSFTVHDETVENDPAFFEQGKQLAEEGWIGDAGAWVTDDENRVLLIRHADEPDEWGIPGGGHEPGETMEETARREVRKKPASNAHSTMCGSLAEKPSCRTPTPSIAITC